jgi:hypothetical protein
VGDHRRVWEKQKTLWQEILARLPRLVEGAVVSEDLDFDFDCGRVGHRGRRRL